MLAYYFPYLCPTIIPVFYVCCVGANLKHNILLRKDIWQIHPLKRAPKVFYVDKYNLQLRRYYINPERSRQIH
jgi:hypothetical protein